MLLPRRHATASARGRLCGQSISQPPRAQLEVARRHRNGRSRLPLDCRGRSTIATVSMRAAELGRCVGVLLRKTVLGYGNIWDRVSVWTSQFPVARCAALGLAKRPPWPTHGPSMPPHLCIPNVCRTLPWLHAHQLPHTRHQPRQNAMVLPRFVPRSVTDETARRDHTRHVHRGVRSGTCTDVQCTRRAKKLARPKCL